MNAGIFIRPSSIPSITSVRYRGRFLPLSPLRTVYRPARMSPCLAWRRNSSQSRKPFVPTRRSRQPSLERSWWIFRCLARRIARDSACRVAALFLARRNSNTDQASLRDHPENLCRQVRHQDWLADWAPKSPPGDHRCGASASAIPRRSNDLTVRPTSKLTPVRRPSPSLVLPRRRATRCRARRRCEPSRGSASWPGGRRCNQAGDRSQSRRR